MSLPDNTKLVDSTGEPARSWWQWLSDVDKVLSAIKQSGTTAQRPTDFLFTGRRFFDTTLGKPVYLKAVVAGDGVWVDAAGMTV